ncbi:MAG: S-adenosylmethionine:tRNA ribosyltransferase-isomerase, partial [Dermatophilaceae bacterium]
RPSTVFHGAQPHVAAAPAEERGLARDGVRLLVARPSEIAYTTFTNLVDYLQPGDVLVVNTSATVNGEVDATLGSSEGSRRVVLHVATPLPDGSWVLELRTFPDAARPVLDADPGALVESRVGRFQLLEPHGSRSSSPTGAGNRLWRGGPEDRQDVSALLGAHGRPIAYGYLSARWPLTAYQHVFGTVPGSAEMASAARPFTPRLVTRLVSRGVAIAPVLLHTGVSSQEAGEPPQPERFRVPRATAAAVNALRAMGGRVVAVGTSATRAIESAVVGGQVVEADGWTDRVVTPSDPRQVVDGLLTGWHDALGSHLLLVEAVAGPALTQRAYDEALSNAYDWHEFGDSCLLLP